MAISSLKNPGKVIRDIGLVFSQRLLFGGVILALILLLTFLGLDTAPGTAVQTALSDSATKTIAYIEALLRGDLGMSAAASVTLRPIPVIEVLPLTVARSLVLLAVSLVMAILFGVTLGFWSARYRHTAWSLPILMISIVGVSIPSFFAALLLQLGVIRLTQIAGRTVLPVGGFGWDEHLILPALVLAARPTAQIARVTYVTVSQILEQDYIRTAHSKGLWPRMIRNRHVIRNAAVPILTTIGLSLRFSLTSLPVVEFFFGWPGMGFTLLKAISQQDVNLSAALVVCLGALFILINMLLDFSYRAIDPRLRQDPAFIRRDGANLLTWLQNLVSGLFSWITNIPVLVQLRRRGRPPQESPFKQALADKGEVAGEAPTLGRDQKIFLKSLVGNLPLILGVVLVGGVLAVVTFGPSLAPHSPYTTQGLVIREGEFIVPPFEPDEVHPWGTDVLGRDIMSLILAGAQQTILLVILVVVARLLVGFILGAVAGWFNGGWLDRLILGAAEVVAAFPTLLLAMIFILALGIRQGFRPFVLALCLVGWGEIMQFIRGEVISIRPKPFIEAAVVVGLRTPRIIFSHILPNLVPALVSLAALEMGAVLMLLGELGFIGIFIGGGAFAELDIFGAPYHYSDVPEWGALLSNVRAYARSYPWTALYPTLAFFLAILGFNLLGEGVRRVVDQYGVGISRLFSRYTAGLALIAFVGFGWARVNTGAQAIYRQQALAFDGQEALALVNYLADPRIQGRALGTPGQEEVADNIAKIFKVYGLQPAGEQLTYFQNRTRAYQQLDSVPRLEIVGSGATLQYRQDYVEYPGDNRILGQIEAPVRYIGLGPLTQYERFRSNIPALRYLDYEDEILLVFSETEAELLEDVPRAGVLVVASDPADMQRRYTLSPRDPRSRAFGVGRLQGQDSPILWISRQTAERLLAGTGRTVEDFQQEAERLGQDEILEVPLGVDARIEVVGTVIEKVPARHVIGFIPGTSASNLGGVNDRLIVVLAKYDSPPLVPDGRPYVAASDNAAGVAVMLETLRTLQETDYQPYKSLLFVAYSGEGYEGSGRVVPDVSKFLQAKQGFATAFEVDAVIELRGLGIGDSEVLELSSTGSLRLVKVFDDAAVRLGVSTSRTGSAVDLSIVFEERSAREGGQEAPTIAMHSDGWETVSRQPGDTLAIISAGTLEEAGQVLTLGLMALGREIQ